MDKAKSPRCSPPPQAPAASLPMEEWEKWVGDFEIGDRASFARSVGAQTRHGICRARRWMACRTLSSPSFGTRTRTRLSLHPRAHDARANRVAAVTFLPTIPSSEVPSPSRAHPQDLPYRSRRRRSARMAEVEIRRSTAQLLFTHAPPEVGSSARRRESFSALTA